MFRLIREGDGDGWRDDDGQTIEDREVICSWVVKVLLADVIGLKSATNKSGQIY